ncbi:hypothetical protein C7271_16155 [filamentous cyanobacterium CCP5]|nr:hypothetical protein C7271_16155 [filamentous cyanobacterium CCP5]
MIFWEIALSLSLAAMSASLVAVALRRRQSDDRWQPHQPESSPTTLGQTSQTDSWQADQLHLALEVAHIGVWDWHVGDRQVV